MTKTDYFDFPYHVDGRGRTAENPPLERIEKHEREHQPERWFEKQRSQRKPGERRTIGKQRDVPG